VTDLFASGFFGSVSFLFAACIGDLFMIEVFALRPVAEVPAVITAWEVAAVTTAGEVSAVITAWEVPAVTTAGEVSAVTCTEAAALVVEENFALVDEENFAFVNLILVILNGSVSIPLDRSPTFNAFFFWPSVRL